MIIFLLVCKINRLPAIINWDYFFNGSIYAKSLLVFFISLVAIALNASVEQSQPSIDLVSDFGVLAGTAVTCTNSTVNGDLGVWPGTAITQNRLCRNRDGSHGRCSCQASVDGLHQHWNSLSLLNSCDPAHTLTGTLGGVVLTPGVYCVSAVAKTGQLILNAQGDTNAEWLFLVDGALTGTNFGVVMHGGGNPCNVTWWTKAAATLTSSNLRGNVLLARRSHSPA